MRDIDTEIMINSHGRPVEGKAAVANVLTAYRDAIQYTHDQTIRHMNMGETPDELVASVKLPKHLAEHPWLGEFYGTVAHSVRQIYVGYNGWYKGDPWTLEPMPHVERAQAYVQAMGGRENVLKLAEQAFEAGNYTFAAEILSYPIRVDNNDSQSRDLKAKSYKEWAYKQVNINWRNWALNAAAELENTQDFSNLISFASADVLTALPTKQIFDMMTPTLIAEKTIGVKVSMTYSFTDTNEEITLEIRNGIVQLHEKALSNADIKVITSRNFLNDILLAGPKGQQVIAEGLTSGTFKLAQGSMKDFGQFMSYLGKPMTPQQIKLIVR
jgi:alkyl sulfatase BDS1-like metallo-beta-lactamase superfamily hydrolase